MTADAERLSDLPYSHRHVLRALNEADDPLTVNELIEASGVKPRTTYRALDKLTTLGVVEQRTHPAPSIPARYDTCQYDNADGD